MECGYDLFGNLRRQSQEIFDGIGTNLPTGASMNEYDGHLKGIDFDERAIRTAVYELQTRKTVVTELGGETLRLAKIPQDVQLYNS